MTITIRQFEALSNSPLIYNQNKSHWVSENNDSTYQSKTIRILLQLGYLVVKEQIIVVISSKGLNHLNKKKPASFDNGLNS